MSFFRHSGAIGIEKNMSGMSKIVKIIYWLGYII